MAKKSIQTLFIEFIQSDLIWKEDVKGRLMVIEEQVKKTNGRVTTLEKDEVIDKVKWGKIGLIGSMALIVFGAIVKAVVDRYFR